MPQQDTIRLLRECDAGVKMGVEAITRVVDRVQDGQLRQILTQSRLEHEELDRRLRALLDSAGDTGKPPHAMAKRMAETKIDVMLRMRPGDRTVASLMTDGCNMGVKSLHTYLNEFKAADSRSRGIARQLAAVEEQLAKDIRAYL